MTYIPIGVWGKFLMLHSAPEEEGRGPPSPLRAFIFGAQNNSQTINDGLR